MKRKKNNGGGANWMDTYGDMVTLLLCFFVLLYSMSNIDKQKYIALAQSFNPDAIPEQTDIAGNESQTEDLTSSNITQEEVIQKINELYERMKKYISENGYDGRITVTKGQFYVFVSLDDTVFFDGDSYVLSQEGKGTLDAVGDMLYDAADAIDEIRILGHTAQGNANHENDPTVDRFLASNRATVVLVYLQEKNIIDPMRLISVGYGQWRPVASNDTSEERAKNRRVELIVSGKNPEGEFPDSVIQYYEYRK